MVLAEYIVTSTWWVDMPEAQPRARARAKNNKPDSQVTVNDDGSLTYDPTLVDIDLYPGTKYADVRAEVRHASPRGVFADKVRIIPRTQPDSKPGEEKTHGLKGGIRES